MLSPTNYQNSNKMFAKRILRICLSKYILSTRDRDIQRFLYHQSLYQFLPVQKPFLKLQRTMQPKGNPGETGSNKPKSIHRSKNCPWGYRCTHQCVWYDAAGVAGLGNDDASVWRAKPRDEAPAFAPEGNEAWDQAAPASTTALASPCRRYQLAYRLARWSWAAAVAGTGPCRGNRGHRGAVATVAATPRPEACPAVFQDARAWSDETLRPAAPSPGRRAAPECAAARKADGVAQARAPAASEAPGPDLALADPGQVTAPHCRSPSSVSWFLPARTNNDKWLICNTYTFLKCQESRTYLTIRQRESFKLQYWISELCTINAWSVICVLWDTTIDTIEGREKREIDANNPTW